MTATISSTLTHSNPNYSNSHNQTEARGNKTAQEARDTAPQAALVRPQGAFLVASSVVSRKEETPKATGSMAPNLDTTVPVESTNTPVALFDFSFPLFPFSLIQDGLLCV